MDFLFLYSNSMNDHSSSIINFNPRHHVASYNSRFVFYFVVDLLLNELAYSSVSLFDFIFHPLFYSDLRFSQLQMFTLKKLPVPHFPFWCPQLHQSCFNFFLFSESFNRFFLFSTSLSFSSSISSVFVLC